MGGSRTGYDCTFLPNPISTSSYVLCIRRGVFYSPLNTTACIPVHGAAEVAEAVGEDAVQELVDGGVGGCADEDARLGCVKWCLRQRLQQPSVTAIPDTATAAVHVEHRGDGGAAAVAIAGEDVTGAV